LVGARFEASTDTIMTEAEPRKHRGNCCAELGADGDRAARVETADDVAHALPRAHGVAVTPVAPVARAALAAFVFCAACSPTIVTEHDTTSERLVAGRVHALPGWHALDADVTRDGDAADVRVTGAKACAAPLVRETLVERSVDKRPETGWLVLDPLAPFLASGLLATWGAASDPDTEQRKAQLAIVGAGLAIGATALVIDLLKYSSHRSRVVTRHAAGQEPARCPQDVTERPRRVELDLADGTRLSATLDASGHARIDIPPSLWAAQGGRLDFDVRVDGQLVSRAVLEQAP
jgi:hypothetical protein